MQTDAKSRALLWLAPVQDESRLCTVVAQLGSHERTRYSRIRHKKARERFLTGRAMAKFALSDAANNGVKPSAWRIEPDVNGKPIVVGPHSEFGISIAHSEDMVAVAVCRNDTIGVDIECLDEANGAPVAHVLSEADERKLATCGPEEGRREFLKLWTMKEAYAKQTGEGVGMDFASLDIDWTPGQSEQSVQTGPAGIHASSISLGKDYFVALASRAGAAPVINTDNLEARLSSTQDELADTLNS